MLRLAVALYIYQQRALLLCVSSESSSVTLVWFVLSASAAKTIIGLVSGHSVDKETLPATTKVRRGRKKLYKTGASSPLLDSPHMVRETVLPCL